MCGIAGLVCSEPRPLTGLLDSMSTNLEHRGPDARALRTWRDGRPVDEAPAEVGVAHRRLSIIDLSSAADQPMSDPSGRFCIVYNGEIYNYRELRERLEVEGCQFETSSDTEVLLQAMIRWGVSALPQLTGMFAFALYDRAESTMLLARDPFGIKPLFIAPWDGGTAFASEVPALLELPGVRREVNRGRLYDYLVKGLTDLGGQTLLEGVYQLPAASWCRLGADAVPEFHRYWQLDGGQRTDLSFDDAASRLRELFYDSVSLHLRSDVTVAGALSGGIDSSAVVMAMRRLGGHDAPLHTFSYVSADPKRSEGAWASLVAREANVVAHEVTLEAEDLRADVDQLLLRQGEPFGSTSMYAQYRVFQAVSRAGIKVSLDGQGADELLCGYHLYLPQRIAMLVRRGRFLGAGRLAAAANGSSLSAAQLLSQTVYCLAPGPVRQRLQRRLEPPWLVPPWFDGASRNDWPIAPASLQQLLAAEMTRYRLPRLLRYADRNAMAHSVESRVPFVHCGLAEFVNSLPDEYLLDERGTTKRVFRRALQGLVPGEILDRTEKIGFETPERDWLESLTSWIDETVQMGRRRNIGAIDPDALDDHWRRIRERRAAYDRRFWRTINLVRWAARFDVAC